MHSCQYLGLDHKSTYMHDSCRTRDHTWICVLSGVLAASLQVHASSAPSAKPAKGAIGASSTPSSSGVPTQVVTATFNGTAGMQASIPQLEGRA